MLKSLRFNVLKNRSNMSDYDPEISQLASILHENGDKVLNALSKLSLNAVLLQKLNQKFELLIENNTEPQSSFQVITSAHGNFQILNELHFLHDFVQKTIALKVTNNLSHVLLNNKVDISKFKNIKYLEIKKIPIGEVIGLKSVQSQLESVVCIKCLSMLEELFANCGGDQTSGFVWSRLKEAVFSFNNLKIVDTSIAFAPWLQVLDLSHNQITNIKAIECLPNLKYVNLSFNCLDTLPNFNKSARKKIELLVMKNNYIEDLSGLDELSRLTELDVGNNWISNFENLQSLLTISTLNCLSLIGNPISCHNNYRKIVANYLHISASFCDFYLDKIKLSKKEKAVVWTEMCEKNINATNTQHNTSQTQLENSFNKKPSPVRQNSVNRKSEKTRLVVIPNLDDGTFEEITDYPPNNLDFMTSSTEHLITKKRIENVRNAYGIDNWLVQGSSVVHDILGLPAHQLPSSTPYDDVCLQAALDSPKNIVTTVAVIESQQSEKESEKSYKNDLDSFVTCKDGDITSNYFSAETSLEKEESNTVEADKPEDNAPSKEVSPDIEQIEEVEDVEELDDIGKFFVVLKEIKLYNDKMKQEEMFFAITENEVQEREPSKGKIVAKWSLSSLESCVKLKSNKLQIAFDTVRRDKRERIYSLKEKEANELYKQIAGILESRTLSDMNQVVYKCESCSSQFSVEIKSKKPDQETRCPFCQSKFILQLDEVPLPRCEDEEKSSGAKTSKNAASKISHNRSSSTGNFFQGLSNQNEEKIVKSASESSIGSAASLNPFQEGPTNQNCNVKRSESDIEILSNPSQSSIEVIDGPGRAQSGSTPLRKKSSEERQNGESASAAAAAASAASATSVSNTLNLTCNQNNQPGLTESSSSGSITDSVCTAYESTYSTNLSKNKSESRQILMEECLEAKERKDVCSESDPILQDVLKKIQLEKTKNNRNNEISYSYSNFTNIDHRIKLFLYTSVFEDSTEEIVFGLRAVVLRQNKDKFFPSFIVGSNKKLYFLKVTSSENGDDACKFLQKVDSLCFNLNAISHLYALSWYQGFGIEIKRANNKWKDFLILLKNDVRTHGFLNFFKTTGTQYFSNATVTLEAMQRPYLAVQQILLTSSSLEDTNIQYFCLFNSCCVHNGICPKEYDSGGILTNSTEILLFVGHLNWLFDSNTRPPSPERCQKFRNLVQVCTDAHKLILQLFDGVKETEVWILTMEGKEAKEGLLKSLKEAWEHLFSIPLTVNLI